VAFGPSAGGGKTQMSGCTLPNISGRILAELCRINSGEFSILTENTCSLIHIFPSSDVNDWKCNVILSMMKDHDEICTVKYVVK
jgi:hypothetical protein